MDKKEIKAATKDFTYGLLVMVGGAWVLCWLWSTYQWRGGKIGEAAQFGDSFGGLNTLLTGLGFVLVALSLFKQHVDSVKAEELRREDKKEEETRRTEAEERHNEGIAAQERLALIQGLNLLLTSGGEQQKQLQVAVDFLDLFSFRLEKVGDDSSPVRYLKELSTQVTTHCTIAERDRLCELLAQLDEDEYFIENVPLQEEERRVSFAKGFAEIEEIISNAKSSRRTALIAVEESIAKGRIRLGSFLSQ